MLDVKELKINIRDTLKRNLCEGDNSLVNTLISHANPGKYQKKWVKFLTEEITPTVEQICDSLAEGLANNIDAYIRGMEAEANLLTSGSPSTHTAKLKSHWAGKVGTFNMPKMPLPNVINFS